MTSSIAFPHLGIYLPHVGKTFSVFGFEIAFYGIVLAAAMLAGIYMAMWIAGKTGQNPDHYFNLALIAIAVSLICARLYYVVFTWDYYSAHPLEILNFRGGGLAIYGGVIGGVATCLIYGKIKHLHPLTVLDTACLGLVLGQSIGRWGNFFNREAFGGYTDQLLAMQIPIDSVRAGEVTQAMMDHVQNIDGVSYIRVHPTFLYESLWNLGVLFLLIFLTLRIKNRFKGQVFTCYILLYGLGRLWIEGLRTDQLLIPGTSLPVSQVLSGVLVLGAAGVLIWQWMRRSSRNRV